MPDFVEANGFVNPVPDDKRRYVASLASIANSPVYYVGYTGIYAVDEGKWYNVSGGDAVGGWVFEAAGSGGVISKDFEEAFYCEAVAPDFGIISKSVDFKVTEIQQSDVAVWTIKKVDDSDYVLDEVVTGGEILKVYCDTVGAYCVMKGAVI